MDTFSKNIISLEAPDKIESNFDYGTVSSAEGEALRGHAQAILTTFAVARKTTVSWAVAIGRELSAAREQLSHHGDGTWGKWCRQACGLSRTTVFRFLQVHQVLGDCSSVEQFDLSAAYALADKTCPADVRSELIRRAENGEHVCKKMVVDAIDPDCGDKGSRKRRVTHRDRSIAESDSGEALMTLDQLRDEVRQLIGKWEGRSIPRHEIAQVLRESIEALAGDLVVEQSPEQVAENLVGNSDIVKGASAHPRHCGRVDRAKRCSPDRACQGSGSGAECGPASTDNSTNVSAQRDVSPSPEDPPSAPHSSYMSYVDGGVDRECLVEGSVAFVRPVGAGEGDWVQAGDNARVEIRRLWREWNDAKGRHDAAGDA